MKNYYMLIVLSLIIIQVNTLQAQDYYGINPVNRLFPQWGLNAVGASSGDTLYFIQRGLHMFDCHDPENIYEIRYFPLADLDYCSIGARGNFVFLAHSTGMRTVRIDQRAVLNIVSDFNLESGITTVELWDEYAILGTGDSRLIVLNISEPHRPRLISSRNLGYIPSQIKVADSLAYLVGEQLTIISLEELDNPQIISTVNQSGLDVEIIGDVVCIASGENGLRLYDISDPANPFITEHIRISSYNLEQYNGMLLTGHDRRETIVGNGRITAYIPYCSMIDISNPFEPEIVSSMAYCEGDLLCVVGDLIVQFFRYWQSDLRLSFYSIGDELEFNQALLLPSLGETQFVTGNNDYIYYFKIDTSRNCS